MSDARVAGLLEDVKSRFGFLSTEFGFSGPEMLGESTVGYRSGGWSVRVGLDIRDKIVEAYVLHDDGVGTARKMVRSLVRLAGLKGMGQSRSGAVTRAAVQKTLTYQTNALRVLMPRLLAGEGNDLMR